MYAEDPEVSLVACLASAPRVLYLVAVLCIGVVLVLAVRLVVPYHGQLLLRLLCRFDF